MKKFDQTTKEILDRCLAKDPLSDDDIKNMLETLSISID